MSENNEREQLIQRETQKSQIDLNNRDPKQINENVVKVDFEDVIAEPDDLHSLEIVWKCSYHTFRLTKCFFYHGLTAILSFPLTLLWGVVFALLSFLRIWAVMPCFRSCQVTCRCLFTPYYVFVRVLLTLILEAAAKAFIAIKGLRKEA